MRHKIATLVYILGYKICRFAIWFDGNDYDHFMTWASKRWLEKSEGLKTEGE